MSHEAKQLLDPVFKQAIRIHANATADGRSNFEPIVAAADGGSQVAGCHEHKLSLICKHCTQQRNFSSVCDILHAFRSAENVDSALWVRWSSAPFRFVVFGTQSL